MSMKLSVMRRLGAVVTVAVAATLGANAAVAAEAKSMDELLRMVKQGAGSEARESKQREARFVAQKKEQANLLAQAKKTKQQEEARSKRLDATFEANDKKLKELNAALKEAKGELTELFGHITSTVGDLQSNFETSLISVQYPNRGDFLEGLVGKLKGEKLPEIEEIEKVWYELHREMTESAKIVSFSTDVIDSSGEMSTSNVVRVGTFNVINDKGDYLKYDPTDGSLAVLKRQPSGSYNSWAKNLAGSTDGVTRFGVDPTGPAGGNFLSALIDSPTLVERWHQGGVIGYIITGVGVFAVLIAIWRLLALTAVGAKVNSQLKSDKIKTNNPLGRVLAVHAENPSADTETLDLKLNEAVLKEIPKLENSLTLLKIIAAVAPLLGLLGTVTGMIITFQAITIYGAGDPKAMAGGISGALVTTVLGLCVAIPTLLLHTIVNGRAKRVIHILEEQAAGIIARHTDKS